MVRDSLIQLEPPIDLPRIADEPLVSVIISNFNYARFLPMAINSVLNQSYTNFEIIICDDGSTDDSPAVIRQIQRLNPAVRALFQANAGQSTAWNQAIAAARGEILCFLDPDDLFVEGKLAAVVDAFMLHPSAGLCIHRLQAIEASGRSIYRPFPDHLDSGWMAERALRDDFWGSWPATSGISLRRHVIGHLLPLPSALRRGFNDAYLCGCAQFITEIVALDDPLTLYRIHDANTSSSPRLTAEGVAYRVEHARFAVEGIRDFVRRSFGTEAAGRIKLAQTRNRWFWENCLVLQVIERQAQAADRDTCVASAIRHVSPPWRRLIWRLLMVLPPVLARWLLGLWWGNRPWKRFVRQFENPASNTGRSNARVLS